MVHRKVVVVGGGGGGGVGDGLVQNIQRAGNPRCVRVTQVTHRSSFLVPAWYPWKPGRPDATTQPDYDLPSTNRFAFHPDMTNGRRRFLAYHVAHVPLFFSQRDLTILFIIYSFFYVQVYEGFHLFRNAVYNSNETFYSFSTSRSLLLIPVILLFYFCVTFWIKY